MESYPLFDLSEKTIAKTGKCPEKRCLNDPQYELCRVEQHVNGEVVFIRPCQQCRCDYKVNFGSGYICTCPIRIEIFNRYGR